MILSINPKNPQKRFIEKVSEVLRNGGLIGYPTDTIYGIGCDLFHKEAIERIYRLKRHDSKKPLSFICSGLDDISQYARVSNYAYKTMRRLLPGPYTFILEATKLVPTIAVTKQRTVGIRVPDNRICLSIVEGLGHPIISTSVYKPNEELYSDPADIEEKFGKQLDIVIDGGIIVAEHSSVIDLTEEEPRVLRRGKGDVSLFESA
jgi:tRNA threonylcarbamoyl adenosine modification protein (Sua5/YciO/YrdC/YwlC family)